MMNLRNCAALAAALIGLAGGTAHAADKVRLLTSWRAEAEHGGFYQAIADGTYKAYGLDVELQQGGPQVNGAQVLVAGGTDVAVISGSAIVLNMVAQNTPFVAIAAFFQKDPQVLLCHKEMGFKTPADLKGHPVLIGASGRLTYWKFLKDKFGLVDDQVRPYTFNLAPFLADKNVCQQGYVTSEPFALREQGTDPQVFLFADYGYLPYSSLFVTSRKLVDEKPDVLQRFVDASIKGWYAYFKGPRDAAHDLIVKDNPQYTKANAEFTAQAMQEYGIMDSGDAKTLGIGAMTDARWKSFFEEEVKLGDFKPDLDWHAAYTLQFVNKKVGM
ncbi:MAG TPA: ABC transporter substrate-binding protein [Alphaproteobacteria bacterium]|nr:ABC transporter substrate-binding protein [Alphaproteobacteria bacterium]